MTVDDAIAYVKAQLADWATVPSKIASARARAASLQAKAQAANRPDLTAKTSAASQALATLAGGISTVTDTLVRFLSDLAGVETGAAPIKLPGPYRSAYALKHPELFAGDTLAGTPTEARQRGGARRCQGPPAVAAALALERRIRSNAGELGAVPIVLAGLAIAVATAMALVYKELNYQESVLDAVEKGLLPATVIAPVSSSGPIIGALTPGGVGGGFFDQLGGAAGDVLKWAALGLGAYFVLTHTGAGRELAARGKRAAGELVH